MHSKITRPFAIIILIIMTALWGLQFPTFKALYMVSSNVVSREPSTSITLWISFYRALLAAIVMVIIFRKKILKISSKELKLAAYFSTYFSFGCWLQLYGMNYTKASTSAFLTQFYCVLIPLCTAIRKRQWPPTNVIISVILLMTGIAILSGTNIDQIKLGKGEIATLLAACFFTFGIFAIQRDEFRNNDKILSTILCQTGLALFAIVFSLPINLLSKTPPAAILRFPTPQELYLLTIIVIFPTCIATYIHITFQPYVSTTEASLIFGLEPVFSTLFAFFLPTIYSHIFNIIYPNEIFSQQLLIGGALILSSIALVILKKQSNISTP
jgi:drug/metabolite transporter (DMT)-like permease